MASLEEIQTENAEEMVVDIELVPVNAPDENEVNGEEIEEEETWKKRSIYKVPKWIKCFNSKAYNPKVVSIGPYHHGKRHLKPLEEHKVRALHQFTKRTKKSKEVYKNALRGLVDQLRSCYEQLDNVWRDEDKFLEMMLVDGCFLLEFGNAVEGFNDDYDVTDPVYSFHGCSTLSTHVRRDVLMAENQVPMLVLQILLDADSHRNKLAGREHFLAESRQQLLGPPTSVHQNQNRFLYLNRWSATELNEAGVKFRKLDGIGINGITFEKGTLSLPWLEVDDVMETMLLNFMAFERLHFSAGYDVISYVFLMSTLIRSLNDAQLLADYWIIPKSRKSQAKLEEFFGQHRNGIRIDPNSSLAVVMKSLEDYYIKNKDNWRTRCKRWVRGSVTILLEKYFKTPWTIISVIAAALLLVLAAVQTYYTAKSAYTSN